MHSGSSWLTSSVVTTLTASTLSCPSPATSRSRTTRSSGATIADEAARITIRPTATGSFLFAIAVNGGPYGAPGQTAAIRSPAATIGWAWKSISSATAAAGART